ncbi:V-type ATP synthase subunit I [Amphibacillus jilinensis]|uniref:V-type ATP synthase subunit I n=1 Tax=Amphibacillus jilinensis TaxID=1216008 RepID=UPI00030F26B4|nr:V-type ATP synthase subunit I [Amphibacillus jilinensis]
MAIAKMKKLTLISFHEKKDQLLQSIQALQRFEVVDLPSSDLGDYQVSAYEVDSLETIIKKFETRIDQVQAVLSFIQPHLPKTSMVKKLKEKKKEYSLEELEQEIFKFSPHELVSNLLNKQQQLESLAEEQKRLIEEEMFLSNWKKLNFKQADVQQMQHVTGSVGTVPQNVQNAYINQLKESELLFAEEVYQNKDEHGVAIFYDKQNEQAIKQLLNDSHFENLTERFKQTPSDQLTAVQQQQKELKKRKSNIKRELEQMTTEEWQLMLTEEYYEAKLQRERSKLLLVDEKHLFIMEGWLEEEKVSSIKLALTDNFSEDDFALIVDDVKEEEYDQVPIVLKNNGYVSPFESITSMYNLPKYNEIDPTPFLAPFYLLFFGMMAADLGYGLLLWVATFVALNYFNFDGGMKKNLRFFHLLSYPTMLWGILYGTFFGAPLPFIILSTTDDVITILIISVVLGVVQIFFGLGINTYLKWRSQDKYGAFADGIGWIGIFAGLILLLAGNMLLENELLGTIGGIIAVLSALGIILATTLGTENKGLGIGLGVYNLYGITGYVGDIVSYTRLMALGVSSASIALAFNMIIGFIPVWGRFTVGILLFLVLHAVNIGLTMLSAYVHGARLIFVEFFGKFYEGGGKALAPLKASEKYIQLKNQKES